MSLIEQLGGYCVAKERYQSLSDSDVITIGPFEVPAKPYFKDELLEYRRQHNIFEEGDWVVIPSRGNGLFQVSRLLCRSDIQEMIHATDEEIQAGRRL